jgi:ankyrin repeat protein
MKRKKNPSVKNNRLFATDKNGQSALHLAAIYDCWRKFVMMRKETKLT